MFDCEKGSVTGTRGVAVTNHPLASAAAMEMLAAGGNAFDATVASLFALTVVEPMMVGIFGGGTAVVHLANGDMHVFDGLATAPAQTRPDIYTPLSDSWPDYMETKGRQNRVGPKAIAVPGNLKAWCQMSAEFGRLPLKQLLGPAIRYAEDGFVLSPYLATCIEEISPDLALDDAIAAVFLPGGKPLQAGEVLVQKDYANTLKAIATGGAAALMAGELGAHVRAFLNDSGTWVTERDIEDYRVLRREPVIGTYRGFEIIGPPPPCSGGVQTVQVLNLLEASDVAEAGFGTVDTLHRLIEAMKIAAADRLAVIGDPAFVDVPIERLTSKAYAEERRRDFDPDRARRQEARILTNESANTTHVTIADGEGNVVTSTQTINSLFGARVVIPGTGIIANNYMYLFDPHPGKALSLAPGKRITSGITALIARKDGKLAFALGLPGAHRIPASAMQAVINLIDHGMSLQEAVEAPRVFTWGQEVEVEAGFPEAIRDGLAERGHRVLPVAHVAGGMGAIRFNPDGSMTGAACWRADGVPMAAGGGPARANTSFWPDPRRGKVY
ncbi:gamma-glutamyltransferase [Rhodoligotrophos defluvii]|uniref:gamma-glutamyltransferase n=1 Tax=Rhodoligotrophos defluvii TaxID=2561934 RepID=UPI001960527F|nr:gamma-glutamyltransferase [Rhodoligotrophos defluvii]